MNPNRESEKGRWFCVATLTACTTLVASVALICSPAGKTVGRSMPPHLRRRLRKAPSEIPGVGEVNFGDFHGLRPFCVEYGHTRGKPIDRVYIERFLDRNSADIKGRVLEVGDATYTRRFGGDRVERRDVLHVQQIHEEVTIIGNLETGENIPADAFDCFICTQTLNVIYDFASAMKHAHRCLKPGGVLLLTVEAIGPFFRGEESWGHPWRFTSTAIGRLSREVFGEDAQLTLNAHGNVHTAAMFLYGLASSEIRNEAYDFDDPAFEVVVTLKAVKR